MRQSDMKLDYALAAMEIASANRVLRAIEEDILGCVAIRFPNSGRKPSAAVREPAEAHVGKAILESAKKLRYPAQEILADLAGPLGQMVAGPITA